MPKIRKPKPKPDIHPLCAAVRSLRAKMRLSQQELAAQLDIAPMTLSRFERGTQVPRDPEVLARLRKVAESSPGLATEFLTFHSAFLAAMERKSPYEAADEYPRENLARLAGYSAEEWELMQCARIAVSHFPKEAKAMKKAAGPALRLVKQVIRTTDFSGRPLDNNFYLALEQRIDDLVQQIGFERLQEEEDDQ